MNREQTIRAIMFNWKSQREAGVECPVVPQDLMLRLVSMDGPSLEHDLAATRARIAELKGKKLDAFGRAALDTLEWREQRILKYLRRAS